MQPQKVGAPVIFFSSPVLSFLVRIYPKSVGITNANLISRVSESFFSLSHNLLYYVFLTHQSDLVFFSIEDLTLCSYDRE